MSLVLFVYLMSVIGKLTLYLKATLVISIIAYWVLVLAMAIKCDYENSKFPFRKFKNYALGIFAFAIFTTLIPSEKYLAGIGAAYVLESAATSDTATELGDKAVKSLNKLMDEYLDNDDKEETNNKV